MSRTAHRLCRRAAGVLRDLSDWLIARAEGLEMAGSYERRRPLRFEAPFETTMRLMSERLVARYMEDLLGLKPNEPEWAAPPPVIRARPLFINRLPPEVRDSLKAYRYEG